MIIYTNDDGTLPNEYFSSSFDDWMHNDNLNVKEVSNAFSDHFSICLQVCKTALGLLPEISLDAGETCFFNRFMIQNNDAYNDLYACYSDYQPWYNKFFKSKKTLKEAYDQYYDHVYSFHGAIATLKHGDFMQYTEGQMRLCTTKLLYDCKVVCDFLYIFHVNNDMPLNLRYNIENNIKASDINSKIWQEAIGNVLSMSSCHIPLNLQRCIAIPNNSENGHSALGMESVSYRTDFVPQIENISVDWSKKCYFDAKFLPFQIEADYLDFSDLRQMHHVQSIFYQALQSIHDTIADMDPRTAHDELKKLINQINQYYNIVYDMYAIAKMNAELYAQLDDEDERSVDQIFYQLKEPFCEISDEIKRYAIYNTKRTFFIKFLNISKLRHYDNLIEDTMEYDMFFSIYQRENFNDVNKADYQQIKKLTSEILNHTELKGLNEYFSKKIWLLSIPTSVEDFALITENNINSAVFADKAYNKFISDFSERSNCELLIKSQIAVDYCGLAARTAFNITDEEELDAIIFSHDDLKNMRYYDEYMLLIKKLFIEKYSTSEKDTMDNMSSEEVEKVLFSIEFFHQFAESHRMLCADIITSAKKDILIKARISIGNISEREIETFIKSEVVKSYLRNAYPEEHNSSITHIVNSIIIKKCYQKVMLPIITNMLYDHVLKPNAMHKIYADSLDNNAERILRAEVLYLYSRNNDEFKCYTKEDIVYKVQSNIIRHIHQMEEYNFLLNNVLNYKEMANESVYGSLLRTIFPKSYSHIYFSHENPEYHDGVAYNPFAVISQTISPSAKSLLYYYNNPSSMPYINASNAIFRFFYDEDGHNANTMLADEEDYVSHIDLGRANNVIFTDLKAFMLNLRIFLYYASYFATSNSKNYNYSQKISINIDDVERTFEQFLAFDEDMRISIVVENIKGLGDKMRYYLGQSIMINGLSHMVHHIIPAAEKNGLYVGNSYVKEQKQEFDILNLAYNPQSNEISIVRKYSNNPYTPQQYIDRNNYINNPEELMNLLIDRYVSCEHNRTRIAKDFLNTLKQFKKYHLPFKQSNWKEKNWFEDFYEYIL